MVRKKQQEQGEKRGKGSILVGIILIFILISSIALAVINRSIHGAQLATDSKKGYSAYQDSDSNLEKILNNIKKLDSENLRIPENTPALAVCDGVCYEKNKTSLAGRVADIFFIKKEGEAQNLERTIFAPLPDRIVNPIANITVVPGSPNRCDARLNLTYSSDAVGEKISNLEVRKSSSNSLNSGEWQKLTSNNSEIALGATSTTINNSEFSYGSRYRFSLKAKNKDPFQLDSLYYAESALPFFTVPAKPICSGGALALGCLGYPVAKGASKPASYTCCGNTECYVCNTGWKADSKDSLKCCTEKYVRNTALNCPCGKKSGQENICGNFTPDTCKVCTN